MKRNLQRAAVALIALALCLAALVVKPLAGNDVLHSPLAKLLAKAG